MDGEDTELVGVREEDAEDRLEGNGPKGGAEEEEVEKEVD